MHTNRLKLVVASLLVALAAVVASARSSSSATRTAEP